jgi:flagellar hook-associated protein 2
VANITSLGSGSQFLMLSSRLTGTQAAIAKVSVSGNDALQAIIGYDGTDPDASAMVLQHAATDAKALINGIEVISGSNTLNHAIDKVSLTLAAVSEGDGGRLAVEVDYGAAVQAVKALASTYNALLAKASSLSSQSGDGLGRSIQSALQQALRASLGGAGLSLKDIGLSVAVKSTTGSDGSAIPGGGLVFDSATLAGALRDHPANTAQTLKSVGETMAGAAKRLLGASGAISSGTVRLNALSKSLQGTYDKISARIDAQMASMRARFVQLDSLVSRMNSTSSYLTQQFALWPQQNK